MFRGLLAAREKQAKKSIYMNVSNQYPTNVLIAEDDDEDYLIFSLAIEELSFKVILSRAENGDILFKLLDENNPDIVFLDLLMPVFTGH